MIDQVWRGLDKAMEQAVKVLTVNELAEYLRVHRSTIYRLLKRGLLPGFKIGSDWRFNVEVIDQWRMKQGAILLAEDAEALKE